MEGIVIKAIGTVSVMAGRQDQQRGYQSMCSEYKISIEPQLGDLSWAEDKYPTPYGELFVRHEKQSDGRIATKVEAPTEEVRILHGKRY